MYPFLPQNLIMMYSLTPKESAGARRARDINTEQQCFNERLHKLEIRVLETVHALSSDIERRMAETLSLFAREQNKETCTLLSTVLSDVHRGLSQIPSVVSESVGREMDLMDSLRKERVAEVEEKVC